MGVNGARRSYISSSRIGSGGGGIRRAWYPSGPRLDGKRTCDEYSTPSPKKEVDINPQPDNYQILDAKEHGSFLLLKLKYPNCTNYEGEKILLYKGCTLLDLVKQKLIDPHFFNDKKYKSPIARFVPTTEGWNMGLELIKTLERK